MKQEIKVPAMGESIAEATIGQIIKPSGSAVKMDEEILELETDKVNQVLYAPQNGVITLTVKPDEVVKIGAVIGYVEDDGKVEVETPKSTPKIEEKPVEQNTPTAPQPTETGTLRITKETYVQETLSKREQPITHKAPEPLGERGETRKKMSKIRKVIAQRLVEAQHTTAMLTTFNEVDMSAVMELRNKYKEYFLKEHGAKLGFMSFFVKAAVSALQAFPDVNSYIDGDEIVHREYYDIGIAVGTERGLVVPVVRSCDSLTFAGIEQGIEEYALKAKNGKLAVDDLQGGGFTITNGGVYGSLLSTPILNPPQSGILGMHKIEKRPIVVEDEIVIRPMMYLALSYDHRIIDGKEAVSFLVHIKNCLEDPARLLLEV